MNYFGQLQRFNPLIGVVPNEPFQQLPEIAFRARAMLRHRTAEQIDFLAKSIDYAIYAYFDELKQNEISRIRNELEGELNTPRRWKRETPGIDYQYDRAEYEIERLFDWDGGTRANGRWIFKESMVDELEIPNGGNTTELQALKDCIDWWDDLGGEGFPDCRPHEIFSVLSLWMLADAIDWMVPKVSSGVSDLAGAIDNLMASVNGGQKCYFEFSQASNSAFLSVESVCFAEHLKAVEELNFSHMQKDIEKQERERKHRSIKAEALNFARHRKDYEAKAMVIESWKKDTFKFSSGEKAGVYYSDWLLRQGVGADSNPLYDYQPRQVANWIRAYAKQIGVRFR